MCLCDRTEQSLWKWLLLVLWTFRQVIPPRFTSGPMFVASVKCYFQIQGGPTSTMCPHTSCFSLYTHVSDAGVNLERPIRKTAQVFQSRAPDPDRLLVMAKSCDLLWTLKGTVQHFFSEPSSLFTTFFSLFLVGSAVFEMVQLYTWSNENMCLVL